MLNPCEDCDLGKAKKGRISERAVEQSKILEESLFFVIRSPSTPTFGSKKHSLLIIEDSTDYTSSYFLKVKSTLKNTMLALIKNIKTKYYSGQVCMM